ncbi:MAG TPA: nucleotidyl transferase AbiEii/AbiGii toxin family protein [Candidatus Paceibacterota bacterium]
MHYEILDKQRRDMLPLLSDLKSDYYLAGGTALALQFGHRDSVDFDFFSEGDIDTVKLFEDLRVIFKDHKLQKTQEEINTLSVVVDDLIKLSFISYKYALIKTPIDEENLRVASIEDIACMKLSTITSRASNKDYIDLYYILGQSKLADLLVTAKQKFPELDQNLILKSLVYFDDIKTEPILFKGDHSVDFEIIKDFLRKQIKAL